MGNLVRRTTRTARPGHHIHGLRLRTASDPPLTTSLRHSTGTHAQAGPGTRAFTQRGQSRPLHSPHPTHAGARVDARPASVGSRSRADVLAQAPEATKAAPPRQLKPRRSTSRRRRWAPRVSIERRSERTVRRRPHQATCVQCTQSARHAQRTHSAPQATRAGAVDKSVRTCTSAVLHVRWSAGRGNPRAKLAAAAAAGQHITQTSILRRQFMPRTWTSSMRLTHTTQTSHILPTRPDARPHTAPQPQHCTPLQTAELRVGVVDVHHGHRDQHVRARRAIHSSSQRPHRPVHQDGTQPRHSDGRGADGSGKENGCLPN